MERLTEKEFRAVLDFLRANYSVCDSEGFVRHVLSGMEKLVPAEFSAYCEMDPVRRSAVNRIELKGVLTSEHDRIWEEHMHEHAVLSYNLRTGDTSAVKISDFDSQRRFRSRGLYNELYRTLGIEDVLCTTLPARASVIAGLALHRRRRNFSERERLIINLLRPHLVQGWRNAKVFSQIFDQLMCLERVLDVAGYGVVRCSGSGKVTFMTPQARQSLVKFFDRESIADRLPDLLWRWVQQQESNLTLGSVATPNSPYVADAESMRLIVRFMRDSAGILLMMQEQQPRPRTPVPSELNLSAREAEVLTWVSEGKTNSEIGVILNTSPRTIQKHLEHIFRKLGVETRTAAAARFMEATSAPGAPS